MGTAHHLHVVHPPGVPPRQAVPLVLCLLPVSPPASSLTALATPAIAQEEMAQLRCREKGCIFPALREANGRCVHHYREEQEPAMYLSKQPTRATLEHGKFFHAEEERVFGSREADRRRLEAEREAFFET